MTRPKHLPDFTDPPLDEVVLGVQFSPAPLYTSVDARDVWELFQEEFPHVQEQPLLQPQFEMFGGANIQPSVQFQLGAIPVGSRLWFLSMEESHLLQFQPDRFLANWRKNGNPQPYPRFEGIAALFERNLSSLASFMQADLDYVLDINQAEVAYINIIPVSDFSHVGEWFSVWKGSGLEIEGLNTSFAEVIRDHNGKPYARLFHAIQSVYSMDGQHKAFNLTLTFRGKPAGSSIASAMEFLTTGREAIVMRFKAMTTSAAHKAWGMHE